MDDVLEGTTVGIFAEGTRRPVERRAEAGGPRWPLRSGGGQAASVRPQQHPCGVRLRGCGWPRLAEALCSLWHELAPRAAPGAPAGLRSERACLPRRQGARAGHRGHLGEHGTDPSREQRQRRREHALAQRRLVGHAHRRHVGVAARVTRTLVRPRDADGPRPTQYCSSAILCFIKVRSLRLASTARVRSPAHAARPHAALRSSEGARGAPRLCRHL